MNRIATPFRTGLLGVLVLTASLIGVTWSLHSRAGDSVAREDHPAASLAPASESVVCLGHVDIEQGVRNLYPSQVGKVTDVLVHEDEAVKTGAVLFRIDDRAPKFLLRQAQIDLRAAQLTLTEARKLTKRHELQLIQQKEAITLAEHQLSAAQQILAFKKKLEAAGSSNLEVVAAEPKVKAAEAALKIAREQLHELELREPANEIAKAQEDVNAKQVRVDQAQFAVDECTVRAPAAGKILRLFIGVGDQFGSQQRQPAIQFCADGPRIVRAEVEQEFASRVTQGQLALVQDDSRIGPTWKGKIVRISDWYTHRRSIIQEPLQFNDVRTLECIVELEPGPQTPRLGQRVRISLGPMSSR